MALSTIQTNNKLIKFTREINREYVRENLFSPYMGADLTAIIRLRQELKAGGEQMNIPLVASLSGTAVATGALVGNEEAIDNYGMRVWIDWARNAIKTNKAEMQKDSTAIYDVARPLLSDWGKSLQRDEIIAALFALPSESAPANLGTTNGQRVNGVLLDSATSTQRNTWVADNIDRVLFGAAVSNYSATFATACANVDSTADKLTYTNLDLLKRVARKATPKIRPYKLKDGREYFVAFAGTNCFRDLKASLLAIDEAVRPRENSGFEKNPIYQDGDLQYNGVIVREIPEIDLHLPTFYATAGAANIQISPVWLCGQSAMALAYGQMAKPTQLDQTDYNFNRGVGIEMAYGISKMFKKTTGGALKEWGVATGFFSSVNDA